LVVLCSGAAALVWFLVRVIPKPSRASYPCQRAAFPLASSFVIWLVGGLSIKVGLGRIGRGFACHKRAACCMGVCTIAVLAAWTLVSFGGYGVSASGNPSIDWGFVPPQSNQPVGSARGIHPGRVVWARDPLATRWAGNWKQKTDQWWLDENTDQARVDALLAATLTKLTGTADSGDAWRSIFEYYNKSSRQMESRGYQPGETVAVKINLNNATGSAKIDNFIDASPQMVLAMVRQLVNQAHVRQQDIVVYDARRFIPPYMLTKVWGEFKDVRFLQWEAAKNDQPKHPVYGDYSRLEGPNWVEGVEYSNGKYKEARLIPKQIMDATYLINMALLKAHSYPRTEMDGGDEGQTAITMTGKNHFGSIKGTAELHAAINTSQEGVKNAYSPMVDLAASPNLGAKTILFVLDGLYCGRKWQSYPQHFPNAPFNNRVEPYENPDWPASVLASMDGVALDSVGLDILLSQTKNNADEDGRPRILLRANADDYLFEMAQPDHAPSGTAYRQAGKAVTSLGVHEHWDSDGSRQYTRNLDPGRGKGIELIYLAQSEPKPFAAKADQPASAPPAPAVLPGKGLAMHDFFYAGESHSERMSIVRGGRVVWSYTHDGRGEISDAVLEPNGNILFAHQFGITEITLDKKVVWNLDAPEKAEIHTAQPIGANSVWFIQNGNPAKFIVINKATGAIERQFELPVKNPGSVHGQFRQARLTPAGTLLVAHMDSRKVVEYNLDGKVLWSQDVPGCWSVQLLANGNILFTGGPTKFVREINRKGETVWEWTASDTPEFGFYNVQTATRLPNGNTVINNWFNEWEGKVDPANPPLQAIEVTPDKKLVWALRSWSPPADLGPSTTIQILDNVYGPAVLPGKGLAQHAFLYTGEWDFRDKRDQTIFLVRDGKVAWRNSISFNDENGVMQELGDATMRANGNVVFCRKTGASEVTPDGKIVWNIVAPKGSEIHSVQPIGLDRVLVMQNGNPAKLMTINVVTGKTEKELILPVPKPDQPHMQFRRVRLTKEGTYLAAHADDAKVVEYNADGKAIWTYPVKGPWSAERLDNGNTLITTSPATVFEVTKQGEVVWEFSRKDVPHYRLFILQEAHRLANGNTVISNWCPNDLREDPKTWPGSVQILEVTPDKKVVWALSEWENPDLGPATSIQLLDEPGAPHQ
jgi:hypothetical protein